MDAFHHIFAETDYNDRKPDLHAFEWYRPRRVSHYCLQLY